MFSKNNNTYLFPSPSLNHHHHHYNNVQALVDHHHHYQASSAAFFLNNQAADVAAERMLFRKKPTPAKKDRHSKIFTSQGLRDRRVRLSIGIARKFFDLQEVLGFDKPSKTLDWLLTKSKASIKDLVQTKEKTDNHDDDDDNSKIKSSSSPIPSNCELGGNEKGKSGNIKNKGSSSSLAKESRAKARARARERTREKMCINQQLKNVGETNSEVSPVYYVSPVGVHEAGSHHRQQELVQESVLVKKKTKNPNSSFFGFQQNVFESGGTHDQNWDVCSFASQANLCAIMDQHKFMNSSSNM